MICHINTFLFLKTAEVVNIEMQCRYYTSELFYLFSIYYSWI